MILFLFFYYEDYLLVGCLSNTQACALFETENVKMQNQTK